MPFAAPFLSFRGRSRQGGHHVKRLCIVIGLLVFTGCGATRSSPDAPTGAGGLVPTVEDKEAGLVGIASGFDLKTYRTVVVAPFPVTDKLDDEGDRRFAEKM